VGSHEREEEPTMKIPNEQPAGPEKGLFSSTVAFREFDPEAAAAELSVRIPELEAELAKLDEAQIVTNEALLLEFSI
jgi:hypothetical protein